MLSKQKKTLILIDGSNFYHGLKKLGITHQLYLDYTAFLQDLIQGKNYHASYHIGEIKNNPHEPGNKNLFIGQQKLFNLLRRNQIEITKGYMLKSDGKYHEKGVDVQIALDIAIGAYEDSYDMCYLISSDTDLIPAIHKAQSLNKKIVYVGYHKSASQAMIHNCNGPHKILTKEYLSQLVK
jgi:uncharacterized LabA/DUF88 family protein